MRRASALVALGLGLAGSTAQAGQDFVVDTTAAAALSAATDSAGAIWVAVAGRDTRVRVFRSQDYGRTWDNLIQFGAGADVPRVEVVYGPGDSGFIYVFYLISQDAGDLRVLRINPHDLTTRDFPVAVGPDTVTGFSVCADGDRRHFVYCLYVNETRAGRNGSFTRSQSYGAGWDAPQPWWNCLDPYLAWGGGSTIFCAWRYAVNGREIHLQQSGHYGRVRTWSGTTVLSGRSQMCYGPVIARSDTARDYESTVWVAWTSAARDSQRLDINTAFSVDGGRAWNQGPALGDAQDDDWYPDLAAFPGSMSGHVYLAYNSGGRLAGDNTTVRLRSSNAYEPARWSSAHKMNDARAGAAVKGCRPRVVCPRGAPRGWAGAVFSGYHSDYGAGVFFDALWNSGTDSESDRERKSDSRHQIPNTGFQMLASGRLSLSVAEPGRYNVAVFSSGGRLVREVFSGSLAAGAHRFAWDQTDRRGQKCGAGIYIVRVSGSNIEARLKVSVVR